MVVRRVRLWLYGSGIADAWYSVSVGRIGMSKYKSKKAKMKHERSEGKKERMMEYGKKGRKK